MTDNNQFTLNDLFGGTLGFTPITNNKPEKKAEKKPEKKAEKKPAPAPVKKEKDTYKLPLKVVSGYNTFDIEGEGEISLNDLKERIFNEQNMFAPKISKVESSKDGGTVIVKLKGLPRVDLKLNKPYTIVLNGITAELNPSDSGEDGEDEDKDLIEAAEEVWLGAHPEFSGCSFIVDEEKSIIVPVMQQNVTDSLELPFIYNVFGAEGGIIAEGDVSSVDGTAIHINVCNKIAERLGVPVGLFKAEDGTYYAVPNTDGSTENKNSNAAKEKMIPTNIKVSIYGVKTQLEPEMFGGKKQITEKELLKWISSPEGGGHDEYAESRGSWIDVQRGLAIPRFKAARKGGYMIDSEGYRIQETPVGLFRVRNDVAESESNSFEYRLPKIPKKIWGTIADFFH